MSTREAMSRPTNQVTGIQICLRALTCLNPTNLITSTHSLASLRYFHNEPELRENPFRDSLNRDSLPHYRPAPTLADQTIVVC